MVVEIPIRPSKRWEVVYKDGKKWQCGIYVPEFTSLEEVTRLEKHNVPELFYLVKGSIVLVVSENGEDVKEILMKEGTVYIVEEWHNAYRLEGCEGIALVIEGTDVQTEYWEPKKN